MLKISPSLHVGAIFLIKLTLRQLQTVLVMASPVAVAHRPATPGIVQGRDQIGVAQGTAIGEIGANA